MCVATLVPSKQPDCVPKQDASVEKMNMSNSAACSAVYMQSFTVIPYLRKYLTQQIFGEAV